MKEKKVEIGTESVRIEKLFGPSSFPDLRITPSIKDECWIVERMCLLTNEFVYFCSIPAETESEYNSTYKEQLP